MYIVILTLMLFQLASPQSLLLGQTVKLLEATVRGLQLNQHLNIFNKCNKQYDLPFIKEIQVCRTNAQVDNTMNKMKRRFDSVCQLGLFHSCRCVLWR